MNPSVFIGGIKERDAGQIEPPKQISSGRAGDSHKTGFPTAQWKSKSLARVTGTTNDAKKVPAMEVVVLSASTSSAVHSTMSSRNDPRMDDNMRFIMSMSADELAEAQRELQAMFKPETLEKFKQSAAKKYGSDVQKMMTKSVDETTLSLSDHTMMMEPSAGSSTLPKQLPAVRSRIDEVDGAATNKTFAKEFDSGSDDATVLYQSMASNLEELKELQRTAPDDVRAALAWAIDDEPAGGENGLDRDAENNSRKFVSFDSNTSTKLAARSSNSNPKNRSQRLKSSIGPSRLSQDRFDLKGRKVTQPARPINTYCLNAYSMITNLKSICHDVKGDSSVRKRRPGGDYAHRRGLPSQLERLSRCVACPGRCHGRYHGGHSGHCCGTHRARRRHPAAGRIAQPPDEPPGTRYVLEAATTLAAVHSIIAPY